MPTAKTSYESYWNKFAAFCDKNKMSNPSVVTNKVPNRVAYVITTKFDRNNTACTCDNTRSAIRYHYKHTAKTLMVGVNSMF